MSTTSVTGSECSFLDRAFYLRSCFCRVHDAYSLDAPSDDAGDSVESLGSDLVSHGRADRPCVEVEIIDSRCIL